MKPIYTLLREYADNVAFRQIIRQVGHKDPCRIAILIVPRCCLREFATAKLAVIDSLNFLNNTVDDNISAWVHRSILTLRTLTSLSEAGNGDLAEISAKKASFLRPVLWKNTGFLHQFGGKTNIFGESAVFLHTQTGVSAH